MPLFRLSSLLLFCAILFAIPVRAQEGGSVFFGYDEKGRLRAVVAPNGEAAIYEYDAAGNFTGIRRVGSNVLELFAFFPHQGVPGDQVTFVGVGFGAGVNSVSFNGAPAQAFTYNPTKIVATVPAGVTTGPVTISTANGSVTTAEPFTVLGVALTPRLAEMGTTETLQFSATLYSSDANQSLRWSVNRVDGGNANIGTISATGLYTAPGQPMEAVIRATSVSNPNLFADAYVSVFSSEWKRFGVSTGVSVNRERTPTPENNPSAGVSIGVSVNKERTPTPENNPSTGISIGVAVNKERTPTPENNPSTGISIGVSVNKERTPTPENNPSTGVGQGVAVAKGPYITSLAPAQLTRGAAATITINGISLDGANALLFGSGAGLDANITASNIVVNGAGTTLTATVNVAANAAPGQRVVIVTTATGHSLTVAWSGNTITIQ